MMTIREIFQKIGANEDLNFLFTNRIPRLALTRFMGWFSRIRQPLIKKASIDIWRSLADLDLSDALKTDFDSLHDCFIRELKPGARQIDSATHVLTSPCDGIVGAIGRVHDGQVYQAKGFPYTIEDLLGKQAGLENWENGWFMTIRITSSMYHRFHAPYDGKLKQVQYFSGDTWNVNPIALKRVEKLFCKNERAFLKLEIGEKAYPVALVPVAAVLVASIRLHALDGLIRKICEVNNTIDCDVAFKKGEELGWFQHGSTILLFVPESFSIPPHIHEGKILKMGESLINLPSDENTV